MTSIIDNKEDLEKFFCQNWNSINDWINKEQEKLPQPITSSVDIRESKFKYAPVDHNMYPAGFNNLCSKDLLICSDLFKQRLNKTAPGFKRIGLLPESHTKNKFYLDHLFKLKSTLEKTGAEIIIFSPDQTLFNLSTNKIELDTFSGEKIFFHRAIIQNNEFVSSDTNIQFNFDVILLNNDQSDPLPINWKEIKIPVIPSPEVGWFKRQKIEHFKHYHKTVSYFCKEFNIDPELLEAHFSYVENVDFNAREGLNEVAKEVDHLISKLPEGSSVFVKASQGTYGMGISVVSSGEEIISMNRKVRNKMDIGKGHLKFTSVLIQEGIETILKYDNAPAEVTIYLVDGKTAGGFMRSNPQRGTQANLNAQGMVYRKLCLSEIKQDCDHTIKEAVYSIIARLSVLAASYEMKDLLESK